MNVFEDLVEELREENLLEETIIDRASKATADTKPEESKPAPSNDASDVATRDDVSFEDSSDFAMVGDREPNRAPSENDRDFFRKRAMDEVASLQMVEHVITGIEREHMKIVPDSYDDLPAKKALHRFLQVQGDPTTSDYAEAEFQLMHETEAWTSALAERDQRITVSSLRRFCENSRPVLSSQALMALSRFYRNAAFSENSRSKFDLVMTRLFTRGTEEEKRKLLFERADMIGHIRTLYANWSSVMLYSADDLPERIAKILAGFDERLAEAASAGSFEELIESAYFRRIHEYKESIGEMFFTPEVTAAAIDCNIRVGNKFVDLIQIERARTDTQTVEQKYGFEYDQIISEAAGKTLHLVEILKGLPTDAEDKVEDVAVPVVAKRAAVHESEKRAFVGSDMFRVNKWLLLVTILVFGASGGLYYWSNVSQSESSIAESASDVSLEGSPLKEYLRSGRATAENFYAITLPAWDQLSEDKKKEVLKQAFEFANRNGQRKNVQLVNVRGRTVAFATERRAELIGAEN